MAGLKDFKLLQQGAEARIYTGIYLGRRAVAKERFVKKYRNPELDLSLTKERIKAECRAIMKCKASGINTPCLYLIDFKRHIIIMEYFDNSITAKDFIEQCSQKELLKLSSEMGMTIGKMHASNIVHGDLTSSNMLLANSRTRSPVGLENSDLIVIDFGLANTDGSDEDKGVDLYVLERALLSTHSSAEEIFPYIMEGYKIGNKNGFKKVMKKFEEVRARGRKRTMVG